MLAGKSGEVGLWTGHPELVSCLGGDLKVESQSPAAGRWRDSGASQEEKEVDGAGGLGPWWEGTVERLLTVTFAKPVTVRVMITNHNY